MEMRKNQKEKNKRKEQMRQKQNKTKQKPWKLQKSECNKKEELISCVLNVKRSMKPGLKTNCWIPLSLTRAHFVQCNDGVRT